MPESKNREGEVLILAKLVIFAVVPLFAVKALDVSYVGIGLSFVLASLLQGLVPPRRRGLVRMLALSALFTLVALVWQWRHRG